MLRIQLSVGNNENIGEIHIQRAGQVAGEFNDYNATYYDGPWKMDKHPKVRRIVAKHERSTGAWKLVRKALDAFIQSGELKPNA